MSPGLNLTKNQHLSLLLGPRNKNCHRDKVEDFQNIQTGLKWIMTVFFVHSSCMTLRIMFILMTVILLDTIQVLVDVTHVANFISFFLLKHHSVMFLLTQNTGTVLVHVIIQQLISIGIPYFLKSLMCWIIVFTIHPCNSIQPVCILVKTTVGRGWAQYIIKCYGILNFARHFVFYMR